jgi:hypothetical protein
MQPFERAAQDLEDAFIDVGHDMTTAMHEVAFELGGEEYAAEITATASVPGLPNPQALKMLQDRDPGSAERVMDRAKQIADARHEQELAELKSHKLRRYGGAILQGFSSLGSGLAGIGEGMSRLSVMPISDRKHKKNQ